MSVNLSGRLWTVGGKKRRVSCEAEVTGTDTAHVGALVKHSAGSFACDSARRSRFAVRVGGEGRARRDRSAHPPATGPSSSPALADQVSVAADKLVGSGHQGQQRARHGLDPCAAL